jgi:hypothetical protein
MGGMERKAIQVESSWTRHSSLLSVALALLVAVLGFLLDRALVHEGLARIQMLVLSSAITGIVAGVMFFSLARQEKARRESMRERMRLIAELNHHIRNALQVIKYYNAGECNSPETKPVQMITESAQRIEWALREFLPEYPDPGPSIPSSLPTGYAVEGSVVRRTGAFVEQVHEPEPRLH